MFAFIDESNAGPRQSRRTRASSIGAAQAHRYARRVAQMNGRSLRPANTNNTLNWGRRIGAYLYSSKWFYQLDAMNETV